MFYRDSESGMKEEGEEKRGEERRSNETFERIKVKKGKKEGNE